VQWEPADPADDVTGYEVYMGYEALRPYDMFPSDSAMERRCAPGTVVREQVVEQQMMGYLVMHSECSAQLSTADVKLLEQIMYKYNCINVVSFICICSSRQWTKKLHK